jgi:murein DD-endopeptidase MepM/ murein hydrolase activator NlpD
MQNNLDNNSNADTGERTKSRSTNWIQGLFQIGLGNSLLHTITNVFSVLAVIFVIWIASAYFSQPRAQAQTNNASIPTPMAVSASNSSAGLDFSSFGVPREVNIHTNVPSRPREDIVTYVVQQGDTVSGIADKYGLQPKTIFAANYSILQDDPESLRPGQNLKILPVDGVYWEWTGGIPFGQWAAYFKVKPQDIINFAANNLNPNTVGDPATANIPNNTWLIVPGGQYQYHSPGQIGFVSRSNPASASVAGPGSCPPSNSSAAGTGSFIYPTSKHTLSGYNYDPKTNHLAIDLSANMGDPIYAADGGLVVYSGVNDYGYGNMVMIDHGNGFQTLYAHLSAIFVGCGQGVTKGQTIGSAGATGHASGPHLHFEIRYNGVPQDPWDFLPPP